jgi:hypothetical protein
LLKAPRPNESSAATRKLTAPVSPAPLLTCWRHATRKPPPFIAISAGRLSLAASAASPTVRAAPTERPSGRKLWATRRVVPPLFPSVHRASTCVPSNAASTLAPPSVLPSEKSFFSSEAPLRGWSWVSKRASSSFETLPTLVTV